MLVILPETIGNSRQQKWCLNKILLGHDQQPCPLILECMSRCLPNKEKKHVFQRISALQKGTRRGPDGMGRVTPKPRQMLTLWKTCGNRQILASGVTVVFLKPLVAPRQLQLLVDWRLVFLERLVPSQPLDFAMKATASKARCAWWSQWNRTGVVQLEVGVGIELACL